MGEMKALPSNIRDIFDQKRRDRQQRSAPVRQGRLTLDQRRRDAEGVDEVTLCLQSRRAQICSRNSRIPQTPHPAEFAARRGGGPARLRRHHRRRAMWLQCGFRALGVSWGGPWESVLICAFVMAAQARLGKGVAGCAVGMRTGPDENGSPCPVQRVKGR